MSKCLCICICICEHDHATFCLVQNQGCICKRLARQGAQAIRLHMICIGVLTPAGACQVRSTLACCGSMRMEGSSAQYHWQQWG